MKNFRLSITLLLLALVLAAVPAAFAQDGTFGLSEEDVALMTAANENLAATSASFELAITVSGVGLGEDGGDVTADLTGTGAFDASDPENPLFQLDVTGTADGEPVTLNLRVVDGVAYTNSGDGWEMESLEDAMGEVTGELGGMTGMGDVDPSSLSPDSAMSMLEGFDDYISLTRTDADGLAQFSLSIDIPGLLSSPEIGGLIMGASGAGDMGDMGEEQMAQMAQMMGMMFADASVTFDEYIDTETETLSRAVLDVNFPLENILGTPGAGIALNVDISLSGYGEPVVVEVPEGAVEASS